MTLGIENGMSSTRTVEHAFIDTATWTVRDVKFVDDEELMIAVENERNLRP